MRKIKPIYIYIGIIIILVGLVVIKKLTTINNNILYGAYDPNNVLSEQKSISIEEVFFQWNIDSKNIQTAANQIDASGRIPLITLEPWPDTNLPSSDNLLVDIKNGLYDKTITNICSGLSQKTLTWIRWGHEMEVTTSRYPWAGKNPQDYISAYQHVVTTCRQANPEVKFIWSPAGQNNLKNYWPGGNYVDYIGLSVYSFDQWDNNNYGYQRNFSQVFSPEYNLVKSYNKPIIVAEYFLILLILLMHGEQITQPLIGV
jgi:endoglucanase